MRTNEVYLAAFENIRDGVRAALDGLDREALTRRPTPEANSIAWLVWHLTRVQDDHVAELLDAEQQWTAGGFARRFDLPFDDSETGYGQSASDVAKVVADAELLREYYDAVHARTCGLLADLSDGDLDRIVDERWDPPVTLGVRLVSIITDDLEHVGQAAYVRGLRETDR